MAAIALPGLSLSDAITVIGSAQQTLLITSSLTISSDVTVPSNVTLRFTSDGVLNVNSGKRVKILGPIEAPPRQIFTGSGTVDFDNTNYFTGRLLDVYPQWWGALGNQVHDDTAAIQAAIDSLPRGVGRIRFPNGVYPITDSLIIADDSEHNYRHGMILESDMGGASGGTDNPSIIWNGSDSTKPMLKLHSRDCTIRNLAFVTQGTSYKALAAIDVDKAGGTSPGTSTNNFFDGVRISAAGNATTATASITSGTTTLTTSGAFFSSAMVGSYVVVENAGNGTYSYPLFTRITAYTSTTQVTVADQALATVSNARIVVSTMGMGFRMGYSNQYNGDLMKWYRTYVDSTAWAGVLISNTTGQNKQFIFQDYASSYSGYGIFTKSGSFRVRCASFNTPYISAIGLFAITDNIYINGIDTEGASRFLVTYGGSNQPWPIIVEGGRFNINSLASDGYYFDVSVGGPLMLTSNIFEPNYNSAFKIKATIGTPGSMLVAIGNHFPNDSPFELTSTNTRIIALGNRGYTTGPTPVHLDDMLRTIGVASGNFVTDNLKLTGAALTPGSGTGFTLNNAGEIRRQIYKATVTYQALSAAAATADKVIATIPAKARVCGIITDTTQPYTGGSVSAATLRVGKTTGGQEYILDHDVFTAAVTKGLLDADLGTSINRANAVQGGDLPSWTATTNLSVRLTTTGANTNALTAGSTTYYIITEIMP